MTESVRHLWVLSMPYSASIHDAMMTLSGLSVNTSKQHGDISESRLRKV